MSEKPVIRAEMEPLLREMLNPAGIDPWVFLHAEITPDTARARYRNPLSRDEVGLTLSHHDSSPGGINTAQFHLRFAASSAAPPTRALCARLTASVRAREGAFAWALAEPAPQIAEPSALQGDRTRSRPPPAAPVIEPAPVDEAPPAPAAPVIERAPDPPRAISRPVLAPPPLAPPVPQSIAPEPLPESAGALLASRLRPLLGELAPQLAPGLWRELNAPENALAVPALRSALERALHPAPDALSRDLARAREAAPSSFLVALISACAHDLSGDADRAIACLDAFLDGAPPPPRIPDALRVRFAIQRRMGWISEAWETLQRALSRSPDDASLCVAGAELCASVHHDERADALLAQAITHTAEPREPALRRARLALRRRDEGTARAMRALIDGSETARPVALQLIALSVSLGDFDDAEARIARALLDDPDDPDAAHWQSTLRLWRGDAAGALDAARAHPAAERVRGVARLLQGRGEEALRELDGALARDPRDFEAHVWRAEALMRLGRLREALAAVERGGEMSHDNSGYLGAQLMRSLLQFRLAPTPGIADHGSVEVLSILAPEVSFAQIDARLCAALAAMRGNRGLTPSYVDAGGSLRRLWVDLAPRERAKHALLRFTLTASVDAAMEDFAEIHSRWPEAAEPFNYEGEVHLYAGDYASARRCFEAALSRYGRSRWAFIGLLAVAVLEGRYEEGLAVIRRGIEETGPAGPTAFVYRGEAHRMLGHRAQAREDLTHAVSTAPSRVGAWINLGLLQASEGDAQGLRESMREIHEQAPGLLRDAARAAGVDDTSDPARWEAVLTHALALLRGNRASSCVTWFSPEGRLRTALTRAAIADPTRVATELSDALTTPR